MAHRSRGDYSAAVSTDVDSQNNLEEPQQARISSQQTTSTTSFLILCVFSAVLSSVQFGYNGTVVNQAQTIMTNCSAASLSQTTLPFNLPKCISMDEWQSGFFVSIFLIGGAIGGLLGAWPAAVYGRKIALLANNSLFFVGGSLIAFSHTYATMCVGRLLVGIGAGVSSAVVPLYIAEISPIAIRGILGSCTQLSIVSGSVITVSLGVVWTTPELWRLLFAFTWIPAILQLIIFPFCVETPKWLVLQHRFKDAELALRKLRGTNNVSDELKAIALNFGISIDGSAAPTPVSAGQPVAMHRSESGQSLISNNSENNSESGHLNPTRSNANYGSTAPNPTANNRMSFYELFTTPSLRRSLVSAFGLQLAQQLSGIGAATYYSTAIFKKSYDQNTAVFLTFLIIINNIFVNVAAMFWIDRFGRRVLLLVSMAIMGISSLLTSLTYHLPVPPAVLVTSLMLFMTGFGVGMGTIPWLILPELVPIRAVATASSVCVALNWSMSAIVAILIPTMIKLIGLDIFAGFGIFMCVFFVFTYTVVPETKGKSAEEVISESAWR